MFFLPVSGRNSYFETCFSYYETSVLPNTRTFAAEKSKKTAHNEHFSANNVYLSSKENLNSLSGWLIFRDIYLFLQRQVIDN